MQKVAVIGLDCAPPRLVFDLWRNELPNINTLMQRGMWGELRSCHPPITVPAWSSMLSSKDPGQLGFYGFRNRRAYTYDDYAFANSTLIKHDLVWDILSRAGKDVLLLGVPQTYPPRPVNGHMVTCFLTPSSDSAYTHPPDLKAEIERVADGYVFDVDDFRTPDKRQLLQRIYEKTRKHFRVAKHLLTTKPWDFFMPGGLQRHMKTAMRFLGLIDPKDATTPRLKTLVESRRAGHEKWQADLKDLILNAYRPIIGDLDLEHATPGQLNEHFKSGGMDAAEVREKSIRFYLSALKEAGVKYSHFFEQRGAKTAGTRNGARAKKPKPRAVSDEEQHSDDEDDEDLVGIEATRWRIPVPGKATVTIVVPNDLDEEDWTMIDAMVRAWIARLVKAKSA